MRTKQRRTKFAWAGWLIAAAGCGTSSGTDAARDDVAISTDSAGGQDAVDAGFADAMSDAVADVFDAAVAQDVTDVASASDVVTPYPAGPYGNSVGQVLANLNWEGYVNTDGAMVSTALPYGPTSLETLRQGHHYGLVHISEFF